MGCKRCGWALESWQKFCPGCGAPAPRQIGAWLWGGAAVLLAGAIGLLGYRVYALRQAEHAPVAQAAHGTPGTAPIEPTPAPEPVPNTVVEPPASTRPARQTPKAVERPALVTIAPKTAEATPEPQPPATPSTPKRRLNIPRDDFEEPPAKLPAAPSAQAGDSGTSTPELTPSIPVVPAAPRSGPAPRPKIGILRPERAEPTPGTADRTAPTPPASGTGSPAAKPVPAPYTGPSAGTLIWSGEIGENTLVVINGDQVSTGRLTGELPGVPVIIQFETDEFLVIDPPGPANGWKKLSLRTRKRIRHAVTIKWSVMK